MAADDPHFRLRIPPELKTQIERAAKERKRSINAEIVARLEKSFLTSGIDQKEILSNLANDVAERTTKNTAKFIIAILEAATAGDAKSKKTFRDILSHMADGSMIINSGGIEELKP